MSYLPMLDENNKTYSLLIANYFGFSDNFLEDVFTKNYLNKNGKF